MEYYIIKNIETSAYYDGEYFDWYSIKNAYFYDSFIEAKKDYDNLIYYERYEKQELTILKITIEMEEIK